MEEGEKEGWEKKNGGEEKTGKGAVGERAEEM